MQSNLEKFLNAVAYLYLTDTSYQNEVHISGIDWHKLPAMEPVKIAKKYLEHRATKSHAEALLDLRDEVNYLERTNPDFKLLGFKEEHLELRFRKFLKEYNFKALGEKLLENPELGEEIISSFNTENLGSQAPVAVSNFLKEEHFNFMHSLSEGKELVRIPNFEGLSEMIGGFNPGRIIMLLGETGFGKTNFAMNLTICAACFKKCLFINMEMPLSDIAKRIAVMTSKKSFKNLFSGEIKMADLDQGLSAFGGNLKFTKGFSVSLQTIEALMRREKQNGLDILVIDYDQKIDLTYNRNIPEWKLLQLAVQRIEDLAKELSVCVILLTQVNRDGGVSASHRATFTAHTVLNFKGMDAAGVHPQSANAIVVAEKNRHGKKSQACLLSYNPDTLGIREVGVIDYRKLETKQGLIA